MSIQPIVFAPSMTLQKNKLAWSSLPNIFSLAPYSQGRLEINIFVIYHFYLPTRFELDWKVLLVTNALAYSDQVKKYDTNVL